MKKVLNPSDFPIGAWEELLRTYLIMVCSHSMDKIIFIDKI